MLPCDVFHTFRLVAAVTLSIVLKPCHLLNELMMKTICRLIVNLALSVSAITSQFSTAEIPNSVRYVESDKIWPFSFEQQGEIKGIQPEVIRLLFQPLNIQVSGRLVPDARLFLRFRIITPT